MSQDHTKIKKDLDVTVLMSGGVDSATCVAYYQSRGYAVSGVFVDYGHPSNRFEANSAREIADHFTINLRSIEFRGGPEWSPGEILGRNAFLVFATMLANPRLTGILALGIHAGDEYYDCGNQFLELTAQLVSDYTAGVVQLAAPLMELEKPDVIAIARRLDVPIHLTYSCQAGTEAPCGDCPSCLDRNAFL